LVRIGFLRCHLRRPSPATLTKDDFYGSDP
jgi:hypothetical protein